MGAVEPTSQGSEPRGYAITARSVVNVLGHSTKEVCDRIFSGEARFRPPSPAFPLAFDTVIGEMLDLPDTPEIEASDRSRLLAISMLAAREIAEAVRRAVVRYGSERVGFVLGGCTGGTYETERVYAELRGGKAPRGYSFDRQHPLDGGLGALARFFDVKGPAMVVSTACSSSAKAFGAAERWLTADLVDAVVVGGADSLCLMTLYGFHTLGAMSPVATRPFSDLRDGLTLGEGAGFVLLERDRPSDVLFASVGESSDAYHLSSPDPSGRGIVVAMKSAIERAGLEPSDIDHVNAHGTGTRYNDQVEGRALAELFGAQVPITSTKSMTGHLLGAAGITEVVLAAETIARGLIPPTVGALPQDPALPIQVVREPLRRSVRSVLTNSLGFGGTNTSIVLRRGGR